MITKQHEVKRTRSQNNASGGLTSLASTLLVPGRPSGPPYLHSMYKWLEFSLTSSLYLHGIKLICVINTILMGCSRKNPYPPTSLADGILEILVGGGGQRPWKSRQEGG